MDKKIFKSEIIKSSNKYTYIIKLQQSRIDIESLIKDKIIKIFLDGTLVLESKEPDTMYNLKLDNEEYAIDVSCNKNNYKEIGININGVPVENSYADPYNIVKKGRVGLLFFTAVFIIKIILAPIINKQDYLTGLIGNIIVYGIPCLLLIIFSIIYKNNYKKALIAGLIIGSLEIIDFISGLVINPEQFKNLYSIILWGVLRFYFLSIMVISYRNLKKL